MRGKKRTGSLLLLIAVVVGGGGLLLAQKISHKTSGTAFYFSCHLMNRSFEEYQGAVHSSDQKGICTECADCHIPKSGMDYLFAKLKASKDIYHEFASGRVDSDGEFGAHCQEITETVWKKLKVTNSAAYCSCHSFDAMDTASQGEPAQRIHNKAQKDDETCIDYHKGIAHLPSEIEVGDSAAYEPKSQAATSVTNSAHIYPFKTLRIGELATVTPGTDLTVVDASGRRPIVRLQGYRMQSSGNTLCPATSQRPALATLGEEGIKMLTVNEEWQADEYGNQWRQAFLQGTLIDLALADRKSLWQYAEKLDGIYCADCHTPTAADHYTVNT